LVVAFAYGGRLLGFGLLLAADPSETRDAVRERLVASFGNAGCGGSASAARWFSPANNGMRERI